MTNRLLTFEQFLNHLNEAKDDSNFYKKIGFLVYYTKTIRTLSGDCEGREKLLNEATLRKLFCAYDPKYEDPKVAPNDIPYLNYARKFCIEFAKKHKIPIENLYNNPKAMELSGSKVDFTKLFNKNKWLPKTVFTREEAIEGKVGFPVIAKIENGHSGLGIKKFDTVEELKKEPEDFTLRGKKRKYDLYSEFIDFEKEYRCIFIKENCVMVFERVNNEKLNQSIRTKNVNQKIKFVYVDQDINKIPKEFMNQVNEIAKTIHKEIPLDACAYDIVIDKDGKLWLIEINAGVGLDSIKMVKYYTTIYKDFYKKELPSSFIEELMKNFTSQGYILQYENFKDEIEKSEWRIDYKKIYEKYSKIPDSFYKEILKN